MTLKVHFDNVCFNAPTGPNVFGVRLAKRLFEMGHEVVLSAHGADVSLVFIEPTGAPLAPIVVQRLDGIWTKPSDFNTKNFMIKSLYDDADAVVWQSEFDKTTIQRLWGTKNGVVIHNGIEIALVKSITIPALAEMRATYKRIYVCSASWHGQKRLEANVGFFRHLKQKCHSSCLIVIGDHPDYRATGTDVFYAGHVTPEIYTQIYFAADWMLHLAYMDHCPNVVVEALAQGTPVACVDSGGTKELIGAYGIVLNETKHSDEFEFIDYDNPPELDVTRFNELPVRSELDYSTIADIDIKNTAKKYVEMFESLCTPSAAGV